MKPLRIIIDGMNAAHRMRHVHSEFQTANGTPTGVLYGFLSMIQGLVAKYSPADIVVAWDEGTNWRKKKYDWYKSARAKRNKQRPAEDIADLKVFYDTQLINVSKFFSGVGIGQYSWPHVLEADDVMALAVRDGIAKGVESIIVSTDQDMIQLVSYGCCTVYSPIKDIVYSQTSTGEVVGSDAREHLAYSPKMYLWKRAAIGDTSDSIPGVHGVGKKTAERIFEDAPRSKENIMQYLQRHADELKKSAAGRRMLDNSRLLIRNLLLMGLIQPYHKYALAGAVTAHLGAGSSFKTLKITGEALAVKNIRMSAVMADNTFQNHTPAFIELVERYKDPNAFLNFFRAAEFQWAYTVQQAREMHNIFYGLQAGRMELATQGKTLFAT